MAARDGHLYATGTNPSRLKTDSVVFSFDPLDGFWRSLVGQPGVGMVRPGPLSRALVHEPGGMAVFANGDLAILDRAEGVMLVVE